MRIPQRNNDLPSLASFDGPVPSFCGYTSSFSVECAAPALVPFHPCFSYTASALIARTSVARGLPPAVEGVSPLQGSVSLPTVPRAYARG